MDTYQPKAKDVKRSWHLLNAKDEILGRLATQAVGFLMGKQKENYSNHMDSGDFVVILNAEKIKLSGNKEDKKLYRSHSGYPGGFKEATAGRVRKEHPERLLSHAIAGMLPENKLKADRMVRLKLIIGDKNPYEYNFKEEK